MTTPARALLEVKGLQKLFPIRRGFWKRTVGYVRAVDGVDFHIDEGETLGLVGEPLLVHGMKSRRERE